MNLCIQSLKTLKKLSTVGELVRMTLDIIKLDLIKTDDEWREWDFPKLVGALREWTFRNPLRTDERADKRRPKEDTKDSGRKENSRHKQRSQNLVFIATRTTIAHQTAKK